MVLQALPHRVASSACRTNTLGRQLHGAPARAVNGSGAQAYAPHGSGRHLERQAIVVQEAEAAGKLAGLLHSLCKLHRPRTTLCVMSAHGSPCRTCTGVALAVKDLRFPLHGVCARSLTRWLFMHSTWLGRASAALPH